MKLFNNIFNKKKVKRSTLNDHNFNTNNMSEKTFEQVVTEKIEEILGSESSKNIRFNEGTSSSVKINHYATINRKQMKALTTLSKEFSCEDLTIKRSGGGLLVCLVSPTEKLTEEE